MQTHLAQANLVTEITFQSTKHYHNPFRDITLDVVFTSPTAQKRIVPTFWAGENTWHVRYASDKLGLHTYQTQCSDTDNAELHALKGEINILPYQGNNPLYLHGGIKVANDQRHFCHADGTPFFWLGDTWWMALCKRLTWQKDFETLTQNRKSLGFNVIQLVAGFYPDMPLFDPRGLSASGFCWEQDLSQINPSFFDEADQKIFYLVEQGLMPCIVGAWGYYLPMIGLENIQLHWRYLMARWGALPVVWVTAGEQTMPWYLETPVQKQSSKQQQKEGWSKVIAYMRSINSFDRLITTHPITSARDSVTKIARIDFEMQQTNHALPTVHHAMCGQQGWQTQPPMPVISGEARYEGLEITPPVTSQNAREAFWAHTLNSGLAGHTYGANGIWQVNTEIQAFGQSPSGLCWGNTPWSLAIQGPAAQQIGLAKKWLETLPWHGFAPQPIPSNYFDQFLQQHPRIHRVLLKLKWRQTLPAPIAACIAQDQSRAIFYTITNQSFVVDLQQFNSPSIAHWIDPTNFEKQPANLQKQTGKVKVKPPNKNAAGEHDWLLLIQPDN